MKQDALHRLGNKGLGNMGKGTKAGVALVWAAALLAGAVAPALAQTKELSDKSVLTLMRYAWGMVPQKFTTPLGKTIEVDKTKPSDSIVPLETAREIIHAARLSAFAQLCELVEEQRANYQTLMRREEAKAKWTDQQMLFINQLHLFTVMTLTGRLLKAIVSVLVPPVIGRVSEKKSLKSPRPLISKSSMRNVFEIRSFSVASQVKPMSPM